MKRELEIDLDARYEMIAILARQYLDAPGVLYGRSPDSGIDCLGVVAMAATQAGFYCPNMLNRTPDASGRRPPMMGAIAKDMMPVRSLRQARIGDMLWLKPDMGRRWDHLAVVSGVNPFVIIHADPMGWDKVREHPLSDPVINRGIFRTNKIRWENWIKGIFRFRTLSLQDAPVGESVILTSRIYGRRWLAAVEVKAELKRAEGATQNVLSDE